MNADFKPASPASKEPFDMTLSKRAYIEDAIIRERPSLMRGIRIYLVKFGLVHDLDSVEQAAEEIFSTTYTAAVASAERFDMERPFNAWALGIALNKMREQRRQTHRDRQHVIRISDYADSASEASEEDLFERLVGFTDTERRETLADLLGLVNEEDRRVLELAYVYDIRGKALAEQLGISASAAHLRLYRAKDRLRAAYFRAQE